MSDSEDSFDNLSSSTMSDVMNVLASSSSSEEDQEEDPHVFSDSSSDTSSNSDSSPTANDEGPGRVDLSRFEAQNLLK